jgi:5-methylcytosine-specific restriction enzyme A
MVAARKRSSAKRPSKSPVRKRGRSRGRLSRGRSQTQVRRTARPQKRTRRRKRGIPTVSVDATVCEADVSGGTTMRRLTGGGRINPKNLPKGPSGRPICRWCKKNEIPTSRGGRATHCSQECTHRHYMTTGGRGDYVRKKIFERDSGVCAMCSHDTRKTAAQARKLQREQGVEAMQDYLHSVGIRRNRKVWVRKFGGGLWDGDHILPVCEGGGLADLDNYRTLCIQCHKQVTSASATQRAAQRAAQRTAQHNKTEDVA